MAFTLNNDKIDNLITGQTRISGGMRTASTMQRPSDDAANARARERRGKKRNRGGSNQLSAQDLIALFQSMPTPNRGFRRPGGDQPDFLGGGLDQFYAKNPGIAQGADRAGQIAAERKQQLSRGFEDGRAAVDFVKQTKGYTDAQGDFVPPTMPTAPSSNYGSGSVKMLPPGQKSRGTMTDPLTGKQVFMDEYLPQQSTVQDTKYGAMTKDVVDPVTGKMNSYNDAGMDYFNPEGASAQSAPSPSSGDTLMTRMQPAAPQSAGIFDLMRQAKATAPQNDMSALFPGPGAAPAQAQTQPTPTAVSNPQVQQTPQGRQDYIFTDPATGFPTSGSLGQKELARRATQGLIPAMGAKLSNAPTAFGSMLSKGVDFLFGPDEGLQPQEMKPFRSPPGSPGFKATPPTPGQIPLQNAQRFLPFGMFSMQPDNQLPYSPFLPSATDFSDGAQTYGPGVSQNGSPALNPATAAPAPFDQVMQALLQPLGGDQIPSAGAQNFVTPGYVAPQSLRKGAPNYRTLDRGMQLW